MSFTSLDRRLRKLEAVVGSDDPRRYIHRPICEWPDEVIYAVLAMNETDMQALFDEMPPSRIDELLRPDV
ncbi:hypothetical protein DF3PB_2580002 [uncultured Defluviicoccus sp.]|uniref:Uncharacterized protein n=1 Tax=metagenome TaxID=256318 RepID=A0A380TDP4_9ZZZZ|nr:hypothetical protein DF3PB_2580002 [uncultured Defluviicoccus sp.]